MKSLGSFSERKERYKRVENSPMQIFGATPTNTFYYIENNSTYMSNLVLFEHLGIHKPIRSPKTTQEPPSGIDFSRYLSVSCTKGPQIYDTFLAVFF